MPSPPSPRCDVHLSVDMVYTTCQPIKMRNRKRGQGINEASLDEAVMRRKGIWRCPVRSCGRCAAPEDIKQTLKMCPKCGEPSDAPKYRQIIYDHRCKNCWRRAQESAREKRERERSEAS